MPKVTLSQELYNRLKQYRPFVEAVVGEPVSLQDCVALAVDRGLDATLADLLNSLDRDEPVATFQQLAARFPEQVYSFAVETLRRGTLARNHEEMKRQLGFRTSHSQDIEEVPET